MFVRPDCFAPPVEPPEEAPGAARALERTLLELPEARREAVRSFLTEAVGSCKYCGASVHRNSARGVDAEDDIGCLACVTTTVGTCSVCREDVTLKHKREELSNGRVAHSKCLEDARRR